MISDKKRFSSQENVLALLAKAEKIVAKASVSRIPPPPKMEDPAEVRELIKQNQELLKSLNVREDKRIKLHGLQQAVDDAEINVLDCQHRLNERKLQLNQLRELWQDYDTRIQICLDEISQIQEQVPVISGQELEMQSLLVSLQEEMHKAKLEVKVSQEMADQEQADQLLKGDLVTPLPPRQSRLAAQGTQERTYSLASNKWAVHGSIVEDPSKARGRSPDQTAHASLGPERPKGATDGRNDRIAYLWKVAYFAAKLKLLDAPPPFLNGGEAGGDADRGASSQQEGSMLLSSMSTSIAGKHFSRITNITTALNQIADLRFENRKMSDELHHRRHALRDTEIRFAALSDRFEKLRVELAAVRKVNAGFDERTMEDLRADIRFYERERHTLYAQLYHNKGYEIPPVKPIPLSESLLMEAGVMIGGPSSPALSMRAVAPGSPQVLPTPSCASLSPSPSPSPPRRKGGMQGAIAAATKEVEDRVTLYNKAPDGPGYLQHVIAQLKEKSRVDQFKRDTLLTSLAQCHHKLMVAESIAMFNFDSFLKGRQTVEEQMEQMMVEHQRAQAKIISKSIREREEAEATRQELQKSVDILMRENTSATYQVKSLEDQLASTQEKLKVVQEEHAAQAKTLESVASKVAPEELKLWDDFIQNMRDFSASSAVGNDSHIMRILPMAAQRSVSAHACKMLEQLAEGIISVSGLVRGLAKDSVRATAVASTVLSSLLSKMTLLFDNVRQPMLLTGKLSLDILDQWFVQYKACLVCAETDTEDLPGGSSISMSMSMAPSVEPPPPPPPPPPPETEDSNLQTGRCFLDFATSSITSQTANTEFRSVMVDTDMVLGTGSGNEGSGFVSRERVDKLEGHYRSVIDGIKSKLEKTERATRKLVVKLKGSELASMAAQDALSKTRTVLLRYVAENAALKVRPVMHDVGTLPEIIPVRHFTSQIYFPAEEDEQLRLKFSAEAISSDAAVHSPSSNDSAVATETCSILEAFLPEAKKLVEYTNVYVQAAPAVLHAESNTPSVTLRSTGSLTLLEMVDVARLEAGAGGNAGLASPSRALACPPLIPLKHTECQTHPTFVYDRDMEQLLEKSIRGVDDRIAHERTYLEQSLAARIDAAEAKEANGVLVAMQIEEAKEHMRRQVAQTTQELAEAERHRELMERERLEHQQRIEDEIREVTDKGIKLETTEQERQRKALLLHRHVTDMQTGYEAIDASVARYKFLDKENAELKKELESLRGQLNVAAGGRRSSSRMGSGPASRARETIQLDSIISVMTKNSTKEENLAETVKELQAKLKSLQRERDELRVKAEGERLRGVELEKQLALHAQPATALAFSIGLKSANSGEDAKKDELQSAHKHVSLLKAELLQTKFMHAAFERGKDELRVRLEGSIRDLTMALEKATHEKQAFKKDLDAARADKDSAAADLHKQMSLRERALLDEFEGQKVDADKLRSHLSDLVNSNVVLQKEVKRLKEELELVESFRASSQTVGVLNKRVDMSYRSLLSLHWTVTEVCANIRKYLLVVAAASLTGVPGGEIGSRVASFLSTTGGLADEELEDSVRAMALEDIDHLSALAVAVRTFAERSNLKPAPHGATNAHGASPREVTPWASSESAAKHFSGMAFPTLSPGHRSLSPPRGPDRLVEVLASIRDQPAITIPGSRPLLQPIDMTVQSSMHLVHGKPPQAPQSASGNSNSSAHTVAAVMSPPAVQAPLVIHDGMPKRVGSSHQALAAKHRQIIQSRNDRDL